MTARDGATRRALLTRALGVALGGTLGVALGGCASKESAPRAAVAVGAPAPAYAAQLQDGSAVSLADHAGDVVLVNIWATWCKPCRQEMPALDTLHHRFEARGLRVVGVSIDVDDDREKVRAFAASLGATYTLWYDPDDRVSTTFLALGVPASYLIGRDGTLRWRHVGPVTADDGPLNAAIEEALGATGTPVPPGTPSAARAPAP